jgi:Fe-S-cluster containining protein
MRDNALKLLRDKREGRWYEPGLHFRCKAPECSHCCSGERGEGYVWLNADEMTAIAAHMDMPFEKFTRRYVRQVGLAYSLVEKPNKDCVFLESGKCSIYDVRPTQCRTYPFWPNIIRAPQTWAKEAAQCPGIGEGPLVDADEIDRQRDLDIAERRRNGVE